MASAQGLGQGLAPLVGESVRIDTVVDETGRAITLAPQPPEAGPLLLAPIYARCPHTCSPLTANLLRAIQEAGGRLGKYRVASLSIDPRETPENLRRFRQRLGLPADWLLVRARDGSELRKLLQELRFVAVERADGQFDHPNVVYVLSPTGVVTAALPGLSLTASELVSAVNSARSGGAPWWRLPVFALAAIGFAASAWVFAVAWLQRRGRVRAPAGGVCRTATFE
ncbi:MAG: SCO family protein [Candidatus Binatia bacterium]|nr:SCO family protein [Candidatus Binatia bacterium]